MINQASYAPIENAIVERAIEWHLQLHAPEATTEDFKQFEAWCALNPQHHLAYQRLESFWDKLDTVDPALAKTTLKSALEAKHPPVSKKPKKIKNISKSGTLGLITLLLACGLYQSQPAQILLAQNKTNIGEQRQIKLSDGSELTLNTNTALDINFTAQQRTIKLYSGEVFIKVAKDKSRPLIIATNQGTTQALGTQFNVRHMDENTPPTTQVAVVESIVEVCNKPSLYNFNPPICKHVHAGQVVQFAKNHIDAVSSADAQGIAGWTTGTMMLDNQPLPNVLNEIQRYSQSQLVFDETSLANMRVSGVLPLHDINNCLSLLGEKLPIQTRQLNDTIVIEAR